jgi:predicted metalloprotease with PDZ domain
MERMNELLASTVEKRKQAFKQLSKIDLKIDSQEVSYDEMLDQLWQVRREAGKKYVEEVFKMRANMTREEWNAAFANTEE